MHPAETKREFINRKKEEFSPDFLKKALGGIFMPIHDLEMFVKEGVREAKRAGSPEDLLNMEGKRIAVIDLKSSDYSPELDTVGMAKRLNENLAVLAEDILLEEYQLYLLYMYNIDGVIFDLSYTDAGELKKIVDLSAIMGINLIPSISSAEEAELIKEFGDVIRFVSPNEMGLYGSLSDRFKLLSYRETDRADLIIRSVT